jgi:predicted phage terminase large subunit-like protein
MITTAAQAARELQIRRAARKDVLGFAEAVDVPGRAVEDDDENVPVELIETKLAAHHKLILREMEACAARDTGRLMIFCPPGSAKSTYASVVFPADYLGRNPHKQIILASYGDSLALKMGRRTRSIIKQPRYKGIHGCELSDESKSVNNFVLTNGSEYMACGILSGVTGNRANGIIIDDPTKGREDADSETIQEKTWEAYNDDLKTRLKPGGWMVIIQTRWNENDLSGHILPDDWKGQSGDILCKDGNTWRVLCLQAECQVDDDPLGRKRGEYLWPEWFTLKHWEQFKNSPRTWGSLYQQLPTPLDGDLFKPEKIQIIGEIPPGHIKWVRGWDLAASENDGDFTAGPKLGRHSDGRFIIADVAHGQWSPERRDRIIRDTAVMDGKECKQDLPQDPGAAGKSQIYYFGKLLVGYPMVFSIESGSKEVRAEAFATQVNIGNVVMVRANWNQRVKDELRPFPNGHYDDIVDGLSRAFNRLMHVRGKTKIAQEAVKKLKGHRK